MTNAERNLGATNTKTENKGFFGINCKDDVPECCTQNGECFTYQHCKRTHISIDWMATQFIRFQKPVTELEINEFLHVKQCLTMWMMRRNG